MIDVLASSQMERHIRREREERRNVLRKEVVASPEFQELWSRIQLLGISQNLPFK